MLTFHYEFITFNEKESTLAQEPYSDLLTLPQG